MFIAKPINPRVLHGAGDLGIPQVKKSKITVPLELKFSTASRVGNRRDNGIIPSASTTFKTTLIPLEKKKEMSLTVPMSPNITKPMKKALVDPSIQREPPIFQARPAPHAKPFQLRLPHHATQPLPVHLPGEVITEEKRRRFQESLQKERLAAEKSRQFHARPLPHFDKDTVIFSL